LITKKLFLGILFSFIEIYSFSQQKNITLIKSIQGVMNFRENYDTKELEESLQKSVDFDKR
jgi:hypothetical protein